MTNQLKKPVTFIATQYKNEPVNVSFYTKEGKEFKFTGSRKVPKKAGIKSKANKR